MQGINRQQVEEERKTGWAGGGARCRKKAEQMIVSGSSHGMFRRSHCNKAETEKYPNINLARYYHFNICVLILVAILAAG